MDSASTRLAAATQAQLTSCRLPRPLPVVDRSEYRAAATPRAMAVMARLRSRVFHWCAGLVGPPASRAAPAAGRAMAAAPPAKGPGDPSAVPAVLSWGPRA